MGHGSWFWDTLANMLEHILCNAESTDSSLVYDGYFGLVDISGAF